MSQEVINPQRAGEKIVETTTRGSVITRWGQWRYRYSRENSEFYYEYLYDGVWYTIFTETNAEWDAYVASGFFERSSEQ